MKTILALMIGTFLFSHVYAGKVDTISIYSNSMHKNVKCVVITPDSHKKSKQRFPVTYLLHGYSGNYANWINIAPGLKERVDEMQMIIVCPDGGFGSWYFDSPVDTAFRYETHIINEVVPYIDQHYKTITDRAGRAITGLSMGGHGALFLAIRHKDLFGAAGSTSGGVDFRPFPNNWDIKKRLGDTACCMETWNRNTVITLVDSLKNNDYKLIVDCGVGDFFIKVNRNLHQKLLDLKIDHDYTERPGAHNAAYWKNSIEYQLLFFKRYFSN